MAKLKKKKKVKSASRVVRGKEDDCVVLRMVSYKGVKPIKTTIPVVVKSYKE